MMIGRNYLLKKPPSPSAPKFFLDTQVVPFAVNLVGDVEVMLDRAARRSGVRPAVIMTGVAGVAGLASYGLFHLMRSRRAAGRRARRSVAVARSL